jgi:catechol 2,3-dioxygenase-like lactoylglutathione lyase family enzyme
MSIRRNLLVLALFLAAGGAAATRIPAPPARAERTVLTPSRNLINSADPERTAAWYRDALGFVRVADRTSAGRRSIIVSHGADLLEIRGGAPEVTGAVAQATARTAATSLTLLTPDVDQAVERLRTQGVPIVTEPTDDDQGQARLAKVKDVDGRMIILREPLHETAAGLPFGEGR